MWIPVTIAVASCALGAALGLGGRRDHSRVLVTFAVVAALAIALGQLLPDALGGAGILALVVFAGAAVVPSLLERGVARVMGQERSGRLGLELGYWALFVHRVGDGIGLGIYGGHEHAGHNHVDVLLALAAHSVPLVAFMTLAFVRRSGAAAALWRVAGLALASLIGIGVPAVVPPAIFDAAEPWVTAGVAGLLIHVVAHDWAPQNQPSGWGTRVVDLAVAAAALSLFFFGGHDHHGGGDVRDRIETALLDLSLDTAPALAIGLALGAVLTAAGTRLPTDWLRRGGALSQAMRGAVVGAPLPICACGVLPLADTLRRRGAGPALVVAFLLATPELGIETFALTTSFIGWPFALVRLVAAVALAMFAALVMHRAATPSQAHDHAHDHDHDQEDASPDGSFFARWLHAFDELLFHVAPWTVVGLVTAAYVQAVLPAESMNALATGGLDMLVVTLVAVPSYICAASATPLAAVLLAKGMSPGAVLVGLLLGPATNLATVGFLRQRYGNRATFIGLGAAVVFAWAAGALVNVSGLPVEAAASAASEHEHGAVAIGAALVLALAMTRSIWLVGLRAWLTTLGDGLGGHAHAHEHDHVHHHHHHHDDECCG